MGSRDARCGPGVQTISHRSASSDVRIPEATATFPPNGPARTAALFDEQDGLPEILEIRDAEGAVL